MSRDGNLRSRQSDKSTRIDPVTPTVCVVALTIGAFRSRKILLRYLVVTIGVTLIILPMIGMIVGSASFLALPFLFPLWSTYLLADVLIIRVWRRRIVASWLAGGTDLGVLRQTAGNLPVLPAATIGAMMSTLPFIEPEREATLSPLQRSALAAASDLRWVQEVTSALLPCTSVALATLCLLPAFAFRQVQFSAALMVGAALIAIVWAFQRLLIMVYRWRQQTTILDGQARVTSPLGGSDAGDAVVSQSSTARAK
jgi:hypothetical protein